MLELILSFNFGKIVKISHNLLIYKLRAKIKLDFFSKVFFIKKKHLIAGVIHLIKSSIFTNY